MAARTILVCDKCGRDINPNPPLGHRQGGPVKVQLAAITWKLNLCEACLKPLFDLYEPHVEAVLPDGTVEGVEKLEFLPRADEGEAGIVPPSFSGG